MPFSVLLVGVIAAGMCALLALNTATAASEVRQRRVDAANAGLSAKQEQLSREVADIQAPTELARLAARLGLVPASSAVFLRINANGTVTVLGASTKVAAPVVPLTAAQKTAAKAAITAAAKAKTAAKAEATQTKPTSATPTGSASPESTSPRSDSPTSKSHPPRSDSPSTAAPKAAAARTAAATPRAAKSTTPVPTLTVPGGPR